MGASNGSVFLPLFAILGWFGLITSWLSKRDGETLVLLELGLWELNTEFVLAELTPLGVAPLLLSAVLAGESPKSTNFGVSPRTGFLAKFILLRALTFANSLEIASKPITPLK